MAFGHGAFAPRVDPGDLVDHAALVSNASCRSAKNARFYALTLSVFIVTTTTRPAARSPSSSVIPHVRADPTQPHVATDRNPPRAAPPLLLHRRRTGYECAGFRFGQRPHSRDSRWRR